MSVVKSYDLMTPDQQMAYRMGVTAAGEAVADSIPSWEEPIHGWIVVSRKDALAAIDVLQPRGIGD